jgi:hypothetical protein
MFLSPLLKDKTKSKLFVSSIKKCCFMLSLAVMMQRIGGGHFSAAH